MQSYRHVDWDIFRQRVIDRDGGACCRCDRPEGDGVTLQVHHKRYISGRKPWEYDLRDCETLCRGCHAAEHGLIPPLVGWILHGVEDLGGPHGHCQRCNKEIRYVCAIHHEKWGTLEVGSDCCDKLTGNSLASEEQQKINRHLRRKTSFIKSKRWEVSQNRQSITQDSIRITILFRDETYFIRVAETNGKQRFKSLVEAKGFVFEQLESGHLRKFVERKRNAEWEHTFRRA